MLIVKCWMRYNDKNMLLPPDISLVIRNLFIIIFVFLFDTCTDFVEVNYTVKVYSNCVVSYAKKIVAKSSTTQAFVVSLNIPSLIKKNIRIFDALPDNVMNTTN